VFTLLWWALAISTLQNIPTPDTALIATLAKQQKDRLARKPGLRSCGRSP